MRLKITLFATAALLGGCALNHTTIAADIPDCPALIPPFLLEKTPGVELPDPIFFPDGHENAQPWREGFLGQTGQLDKSNDKPGAVDHIYRTCLDNARKQLHHDRKSAIGRLFGQAAPSRALTPDERLARTLFTG